MPELVDDDLCLVKQRYIDALVRPREAIATTGQYYRYPEQLLEPVQCIDRDQVRHHTRTLSPEGAWPDIDYGNGFSATDEACLVGHLGRLLRLARFARAGHDAEAHRAALSALGYWLEHDFRHDSWWWLRLGTQKWIFRVALLLEHDLTPDQADTVQRILARAAEHPFTTGQNLVWSAEIAAVAALLRGDQRRVGQEYRRVADEIRVTLAEGIQPDMSFHQHGPCLYSHGYGKSFAADCSRIAGLVAGTGFAFAPQTVDLLARYILDGQQWLTRGAYVDYGAVGRRTGRRNQTARHLHDIAGKMLKLQTGREDEFRRLTRRSLGHDVAPLVGNRHFWCSDMMVHHRPGFYASARMHSTRVLNTDQPYGGTGRLNHHIADGCTFILRRGDEYLDITPVWDWQKIPGTTAVQLPKLDPEPGDRTGLGRKGERSFVGGASDGTWGLAAQDFAHRSYTSPEHIDLTGRMGWFFFDTGFACLGAGITGRGPQPVVTTVNQCYLRGPVRAMAGSQTSELTAGEHNLQGPVRVQHDGITYVFPKAASLHLSNTTQTGSWRHVNALDSDTPVSHDVFKLWIDHGPRPVDASYVYFVLPTGDSARGDLPQVLSNTPKVQAVRHASLGLVQVAFYAPGRLRVGPGVEIGVNRACLLMVKEESGGLRITLAHPARRRHTVAVTVGCRLRGEGVEPTDDGRSRVVFNLPGGKQAGKSVTRTLNYDR